MPRVRFNRGAPAPELVHEFSRQSWCKPCRTSDHRSCEDHPENHRAAIERDLSLHGEAFTARTCLCPCEGEITDSKLLIDLVADLRTQVVQGLREDTAHVNTDHEIEEWAARFAEKVVITLNNALVDDGGMFDPSNKDEIFHVMSELDEMTRTAPVVNVVSILGEPDDQPHADTA